MCFCASGALTKTSAPPATGGTQCTDCRTPCARWLFFRQPLFCVRASLWPGVVQQRAEAPAELLFSTQHTTLPFFVVAARPLPLHLPMKPRLFTVLMRVCARGHQDDVFERVPLSPLKFQQPKASGTQEQHQTRTTESRARVCLFSTPTRTTLTTLTSAGACRGCGCHHTPTACLSSVSEVCAHAMTVRAASFLVPTGKQ